MAERWGWVEWLWLAVAAGVVCFLLFAPPAVGLADSGDFVKITRAFAFDVDAPEDDNRWFQYVFLRYRFNPAWQWWSGFPSSEMALTQVAVWVNRVLVGREWFDLRVMGAVHGAVFLAGVWWFLGALRGSGTVRKCLLAAAGVLVFCDAAYVSHFNSFYMDAAAYLFLLCTVVLYVRAGDGGSRWWTVALGLAAVLFVTAKIQHSLLGLPLAAALGWRRRFGMAALVAAVSVAWVVQGPADYASRARYNVIFYKLLPYSSDAAGDLVALGLDASFMSRVGHHSYEPGTRMEEPEFNDAFGRRATLGRLLAYYLRHPAVVLRLMADGLEEATYQRARLGNYAREAGKGPGARTAAFAWWSGGKERVFGGRTWWYAGYAAALCAMLPVIGWRRKAWWTPGALALSAAAVMALGIGTLADVLDSLRHLFLFNTMLDVMLLGLAAALSTGLPLGRNALEQGESAHEFARTT